MARLLYPPPMHRAPMRVGGRLLRMPIRKMLGRRLLLPHHHEVTVASAPAGDVREALPLAWARVALGALFLLRTTPVLAPLHLPYLSGTSPLVGWPDDA